MCEGGGVLPGGDMRNLQTRKHRLATEWLGRRLDLGALLIGPLFVLIWGLVPSIPRIGPSVMNEAPALYVQAWSVPLRQVPVHVRPYLVTLPSRFSFVPKFDVSEATTRVPAFAYDTSLGGVGAKPQSLGGDVPAPHEWLAGMRYALAPQRERPVPMRRRFVQDKGPWEVRLSSGLAGSRFLRESPRLAVLPAGAQAWEAKFWISFDTRGIPQEVYLERSSGIRGIDRGLLRVLASPDVWEQASGAGLIVLRHDPVMGGENADTDG